MRTVISCVFLLLSLSVKAQVTIGSNIPPVRGAILQLTEQQPDENNITAISGGLLLPRVALLSETSLIPLMSDTVGQNKIHTGLMVYNIKPTGGLGTGTYVWSGTQWRKMDCSMAIDNKVLFIESRSVEVHGYGIGISGGTFNGSRPFEDNEANPPISYSLVIPAGLLKQDYGYIAFSIRAFRSNGAGIWHVGLKVAIDGAWKDSYLHRWGGLSNDFVKNGRIFYNKGKLSIETVNAEYSSVFDYDFTKDLTIAIYAGTDDSLTRETIDYARFEWHP